MTGRRSDGYHELDTLVVFADLGDALRVAPAPELSLAVAGPFAENVPLDGSNLAMRAAEALRRAAGVGSGAHLVLEKRLPPGAGFGGGSSDAAAALKALSALWGLSPEPGFLADLAQLLGADVPMCLEGRALRARGVGEAIEPIKALPELPMLLAWPGRPVSTASVFRSLDRADNPPLPPPGPVQDINALAAYLRACRNDLQAPALALEPAIGAALAAISAAPGCLLARMSGSGSGCFGLFDCRDAATEAVRALKSARTDWWTASVMCR